MKKLILTSILYLLFGGCAREEGDPFILMSLNQEIELGQQVSDEVMNDTEVEVLDETEHAEAYTYLRGIISKILASDDIRYNTEFNYMSKIKIINADILNAFATPGGHIFVYTGLIKYLDSEDELAGVIGHEIAHADRRHSAEVIQKAYGLSIILSIVNGQDPGQLQTIASGLLNNLAILSFTRSNESQADEYAVKYTADTEYSCTGVAGFFEKLESEGQGCGATAAFAEWLSTHPCPENRVQAINDVAAAESCSTASLNPDSYQDFKNLLP